MGWPSVPRQQQEPVSLRSDRGLRYTVCRELVTLLKHVQYVPLFACAAFAANRRRPSSAVELGCALAGESAPCDAEIDCARELSFANCVCSDLERAPCGTICSRACLYNAKCRSTRW